MTDTERPISTLTGTNFADNQADASITEQDIRDLIVSLACNYGSLYISSAAATTIGTVDTWVKVAGTTTVGSDLRNVTMPANNRLRNDGDNTRVFRVSACLDFLPASANKILGFGFAKNGTIVSETEIRKKTLVATDESTISIEALISLDPTDYVEVFVANRTDGTNATVTRMQFTMVGMPT
jgi:hypothetical protein